jgi:hypothetical protein
VPSQDRAVFSSLRLMASRALPDCLRQLLKRILDLRRKLVEHREFAARLHESMKLTSD